MPPTWHLYIVRCRDGTLYTGIATDVARRLVEHEGQGPRGARYLRGRGPLAVALTLEVGARGAALKLEHRVKRMSRAEKEALVSDPAAARSLAEEPAAC